MSAQLRKLAHIALKQYGIENAKLTLLNDSENLLFRVDAQARYGLRVYHPDDGVSYVNLLSDAAIRSELLWLLSLRGIGLVVPEPLRAQNGDLIVHASTPQIPEGRRCALFAWVDGRFRDASLTPKALENVGAFIAKMHNHAEAFKPPPDFLRYRWDWQREFGEQAPLMTNKADMLSPEVRDLFRSMKDIIARTMDELGETPANFGLIHSDLHEGNYLFQGDEVRAIDFAEVGWSYYLFDVAVTLYFLRNRPDFAQIRASMLRGYSALRPLPPDYDRHIDAFCVMRAVDLMNYVLDDESLRTSAQLPKWLASFEQGVRMFSGR